MEMSSSTDSRFAPRPSVSRRRSAVVVSTTPSAALGDSMTGSRTSPTVWAHKTVRVSAAVTLTYRVLDRCSRGGAPACEDPTSAPSARPITLSERVRVLQDEARRLAAEHVDSLGQALRATARIAREVAGGGDPYPAGIRDAARRAEAEIEAQADTIEAIAGRIPASWRTKIA